MSDMNPFPDFLSADAFEDSVSARSDSRDSLFLSAEIDVVGWSAPLTVRVRNLSAGGLLAESPQLVAVGQHVRVRLANIGIVTARCVWAGENRFGLAFDRQIDPQTVRNKPASRSDVPATLVRMSLHTTKFKKPMRPV